MAEVWWCLDKRKVVVRFLVLSVCAWSSPIQFNNSSIFWHYALLPMLELMLDFSLICAIWSSIEFYFLTRGKKIEHKIQRMSMRRKTFCMDAMEKVRLWFEGSAYYWHSFILNAVGECMCAQKIVPSYHILPLSCFWELMTSEGEIEKYVENIGKPPQNQLKPVTWSCIVGFGLLWPLSFTVILFTST